MHDFNFHITEICENQQWALLLITYSTFMLLLFMRLQASSGLKNQDGSAIVSGVPLSPLSNIDLPWRFLQRELNYRFLISAELGASRTFGEDHGYFITNEQINKNPVDQSAWGKHTVWREK